MAGGVPGRCPACALRGAAGAPGLGGARDRGRSLPARRGRGARLQHGPGADVYRGGVQPHAFGTDDIRSSAVLAVTLGAHRGRLLHGGLHGVALSDDGGATWRPSGLWQTTRYWVDAFGKTKGPEGQPRLLASLRDFWLPHGRVAYSDDEGETWSTPMALPDASDGGVGYGLGRFVSLAPVGLPQSALAAMARGYIYRTDDGGETWTLIGRAPIPYSITWVRDALLDEQGRLVVAVPGDGLNRRNGVFRTATPIPVAAEEPLETFGASLRIEPNPASGVAQIRLTLATPEADVRVSVFDARGREVAVAASGARGAGEHSFAVDTSPLAVGVYVVRAEVGDEVASGRFVVAR